jgi:hypothetical protein
LPWRGLLLLGLLVRVVAASPLILIFVLAQSPADLTIGHYLPHIIKGRKIKK